MVIQDYPDELDYVNAQLVFHHREVLRKVNEAPLAYQPEPQRFIVTFCLACLKADSDNYELLRPALIVFMQKYPADPVRLHMERSDRGLYDE